MCTPQTFQKPLSSNCLLQRSRNSATAHHRVTAPDIYMSSQHTTWHWVCSQQPTCNDPCTCVSCKKVHASPSCTDLMRSGNPLCLVEPLCHRGAADKLNQITQALSMTAAAQKAAVQNTAAAAQQLASQVEGIHQASADKHTSRQSLTVQYTHIHAPVNKVVCNIQVQWQLNSCITCDGTATLMEKFQVPVRSSRLCGWTSLQCRRCHTAQPAASGAYFTKTLNSLSTQ